jgi:heme/copper-type cytochrome/quinol oxidase subunit 2
VPVEFQVTSADVNHGFGIYDRSGRLLAQTQAMPGITNRLVYTFSGAAPICCARLSVSDANQCRRIFPAPS